VKAATGDLARTNQELRETKRVSRNLLHSTVDAILTADNAGLIAFVNEGAVRMFGYPRQELIGVPMDRCIRGQDEASYVQRLLRENATVQNYEDRIETEEGVADPREHVHFVREGRRWEDRLDARDLQRHHAAETARTRTQGNVDQRFRHRLVQSALLLRPVDGESNAPAVRSIRCRCSCSTSTSSRPTTTATAILPATACCRRRARSSWNPRANTSDTGFRYGGDEFTVVLPEADEAKPTASRNVFAADSSRAGSTA